MAHEEVMEQVREKIDQTTIWICATLGLKLGIIMEQFPKDILDEAENQILSIPEILIEDPDQSYPDMVFFCPNCEKMVKNTKCNVIGKDCFKVIPKELDV